MIMSLMTSLVKTSGWTISCDLVGLFWLGFGMTDIEKESWILVKAILELNLRDFDTTNYIWKTMRHRIKD